MIETFFLLFIFIFVILLAYFVTKKLATLGTTQMQGKNLKILETTQVSMSQQIHLVQVGDQMFTIGVSKDRITYLTEIDSNSINLDLYTTAKQEASFEHYLKKWTQKKKH